MSLVFPFEMFQRASCSAAERNTLVPLVDEAVQMCELARKKGILALDNGSDLDDLSEPFLRQGLQMAADGADPDRIWQGLWTRMNVVRLTGVGLLSAMVSLEAVIGIQSGCTPSLLRESLIWMFALSDA